MINKALVTAVALALLPSFAMAAPMTAKPVPAATKTIKAEKVKLTKHHHIVKKIKAAKHEPMKAKATTTKL